MKETEKAKESNSGVTEKNKKKEQAAIPAPVPKAKPSKKAQPIEEAPTNKPKKKETPKEPSVPSKETPKEEPVKKVRALLSFRTFCTKIYLRNHPSLLPRKDRQLR